MDIGTLIVLIALGGLLVWKLGSIVLRVPVAPKPHQITGQRLDPEPLRERRDRHDPGIADAPAHHRS